MDCRRKRLFRRRSRSVSPSRAEPSSPTRSRWELIKVLVEEGTATKSPATPSRRALTVSKTPGGTSCPTGDSVPVMTTSRGTNRPHDSSMPLQCADVLVKTEEMDIPDAGAEEVFASPWRERWWMSDLYEPECSEPDPLLPNKTPTKSHLENAPSVPNVTFVEADICPSVSGMTTTSKPVVKQEVNVVSDLDSEYDDEFDTAPIQDIVNVGMRRDIPDNDDLDEPTRETINAVQSAMDEEVDRLFGQSNVYTWEEDFKTFKGRPEIFSGPTPGPIKDYDTAYDAFTDIWSKDIMELIARETNRYAKQTIDALKASGNLMESSRLHQWVDTDVDEMMTLFAVYMFMGIDPRTSQDEYWRTNSYLEMAKFRQLMSYNRYVLLSKFLHFMDNSDVSPNQTSNEGVVLSPKPAKLAPVISHLNQKFSSLYNLEDKISIDESLTLFKGPLSWVQAIRTKAARIGLKSFELCESRTGYMYKFQIYTGKNSEGNSTADAPLSADLGGKTTHIVVDLLKGLENRRHCVTMGNFYNSPALARYLKSLGFDNLGTLHTNRKNVPSDIAEIPKNVAKGTIIARHCGDVSIVAWKDSSMSAVVPVISTYHDAETYVGTKAGNVITEPVCVRDYNKAMGGLDLRDQKLSMYLLERKRGVKWYVKMFKRLLNISIHNAFVSYVCSLRRRKISPMTYREFRYELANSIVEEHRASQLSIPAQVDEIMRLRRDVMHVPKYAGGRQNRKRCVVCSWHGNSKMVHTQCMTCGEYLCFEKCWIEWHSSPNLKDERSRARKRSRND